MKKLLKILPLVAVAFAAILTFSGCDKILEMIYPEETGTGGGGTGGEYGVTLRVNISTGVAGWGSSQIVVRLTSSSGYTKDIKGFAYSADGVSAMFAASFDYVAEGDYSVFAWLDLNGNNAFESASEASGGRDWFHLPYTDYSSGGTILNHPSFDVTLIAAAGDTNAVTLKVLVDKATFGDQWNTANLAVELRNMEGLWFPDSIRHGTAVEMDPVESFYDPMKGVWTVTYEYLPAGTYQMFAWVDTNGDWAWNQYDGEIGVQIATDHGNIFPIPYYNPWEPGTVFAPEWAAYLFGESWVDPSFWMTGPSSVDKSAPAPFEIYAYPYASTKTFSNVSFRIMDEWYGPVQYAGTTDYVGAADTNLSDGNAFSFVVNPANLTPPLGDPTWDARNYLIVRVSGTYTDGTSFESDWWVYLTDTSGGGSSYNLTVEMELEQMAPWGYVDVYVVDSYDGTQLAYSWAYLDEFAKAAFTFSIFDPVGLDQRVYYYLYDQYWNYLGYYEYYLTGDLSGDLTLVADDWGAWFPEW